MALKGLLESTTRVVSGIALDSAWLEVQVRLFKRKYYTDISIV